MQRKYLFLRRWRGSFRCFSLFLRAPIFWRLYCKVKSRESEQGACSGGEQCLVFAGRFFSARAHALFKHKRCCCLLSLACAYGGKWGRVSGWRAAARAPTTTTNVKRRARFVEKHAHTVTTTRDAGRQANVGNLEQNATVVQQNSWSFFDIDDNHIWW